LLAVVAVALDGVMVMLLAVAVLADIYQVLRYLIFLQLIP
jgi:hypothetical protein